MYSQVQSYVTLETSSRVARSGKSEVFCIAPAAVGILPQTMIGSKTLVNLNSVQVSMQWLKAMRTEPLATVAPLIKIVQFEVIVDSLLLCHVRAV